MHQLMLSHCHSDYFIHFHLFIFNLHNDKEEEEEEVDNLLLVSVEDRDIFNFHKVYHHHQSS